MDAVEFKMLEIGMFEEEINILSVEDLKNKDDRTLLYGFTCDRDTWHVYLKSGKIFCVKYPYKGTPSLVSICKNEDFVPNKRLYPERCDFEFCKLLKEKGINLPFTKWQELPETKGFYGEIL